MTPEIVWKRVPHRSGWECYRGSTYFGIVYTNGEAWIGNDPNMRDRGSPYLRALEMVRYIKSGGQP